MIKILLVEDDASLREIYGVRLLAEGYDIVSASDGEEALAMAIKERPSLIITDVMMPKISGFDMLDILRSTTETRNIKVIVMTALGSEEQRARGNQLGADRYLVKSQVGIEDVVRTVYEVLEDKPATGPSAPTTPSAPNPPAAPPVAPAPTVPAPTPPPVTPPMPATPTTQIPVSTPNAPANSYIDAPSSSHVTTQPNVAPTTAMPINTPHTALPVAPAPVARNKVIQPISDPAARVNINDLLDRELAREAGLDLNAQPISAAEEKAAVQDQLDQFSGIPTIPQEVANTIDTGAPVTPPAPTVEPTSPPDTSSPATL